MPDVREKLDKQLGMELVGSSPEELAALMKTRNSALGGAREEIGRDAMTERHHAHDLKPDTLEQLRHVSVATLCTQLFKRGFRNVFIQGIARLTEPSRRQPGRSRVHDAQHPGARGSRPDQRVRESRASAAQGASRACRPATCW